MQEALLAVLALAAASAPFLTRRVLLVFPSKQHKGLGLRLFELVVFYFLTGLFALFLEQQAHGARYPQDWAFYVVTACLFLVFAFPGFVWRYLWQPTTPKRAD